MVSMFEVAIPAFQSRVKRRNHVLKGMTHGTLRLGADFIPQRHQTFLAYPTAALVKIHPPTQLPGWRGAREGRGPCGPPR
jgi:hypothetical protein